MLNLLAAILAFQITPSTYHYQHLTGINIPQQHSIAALVINAAH